MDKKIIIGITFLLLISLSACSTLNITSKTNNVQQTTNDTITKFSDLKYNSEDKICYCKDKDRLDLAEDKLYTDQGVANYDSYEEVDINVFNFITRDTIKTEDGGYERKDKVNGVKINLALLEDCHQSNKCKRVIYEKDYNGDN